MKWLKALFSPAHIFATLGFTFQYILPLLFFGTVIPYTHDGIGAGLTKMGYIAVVLFLLICFKKLKEKLLSHPKSLKRGIVLSIFPIVLWLVINISVDYIVSFIADFSEYWDKVLIFILLGRLFYVIYEAEADSNG